MFFYLLSGRRSRALYEFDPWTGLWKELFRNPTAVKTVDYLALDMLLCLLRFDVCFVDDAPFLLVSCYSKSAESLFLLPWLDWSFGKRDDLHKKHLIVWIPECSVAPRLRGTCIGWKFLVYLRGEGGYV